MEEEATEHETQDIQNARCCISLTGIIRALRIVSGLAIIFFLHFWNSKNLPSVISLIGDFLSLILMFPIIFVYFELYQKLIISIDIEDIQTDSEDVENIQTYPEDIEKQTEVL